MLPYHSFGAFIHELAHAKHAKLTLDKKWKRSEFESRWFKIQHQESYGKLWDLDEDEKVIWKNTTIDSQLPAFGFSSAYGNTEFKEDYAEMVMQVYEHSFSDFWYSYLKDPHYGEIYLQKLLLLREFQFIDEQTFQTILGSHTYARR